MIQSNKIDGLLLREMVIAGTAQLDKNREMVDALNVFPVPDGDTGTNMSLTMNSALSIRFTGSIPPLFYVVIL